MRTSHVGPFQVRPSQTSPVQPASLQVDVKTLENSMLSHKERVQQTLDFL